MAPSPVYQLGLEEQGRESERNPSFKGSLAFKRKSANWLIIELSKVEDIDGKTTWFEQVIERYHKRDVSYRRINNLVKYLNRNPLGDYFYKQTKPSGAVIAHHKRRRLIAAPMSSKRLKTLIEERTVDYFTVQAPVDLRKLSIREQKLEDRISEINEERYIQVQIKYYQKIYNQLDHSAEKRKVAQLIRSLGGINEDDQQEQLVMPIYQPIDDRSGRTRRAMRGISNSP